MASRRKRKSQDISEAAAPVDASVDAAEETRRTECVARIEALQAEVGEINAGASLSPRRRRPPEPPPPAARTPGHGSHAPALLLCARRVRRRPRAPIAPLHHRPSAAAGTHTEFLNKCSLFEQEKHNLLQQAEQNKQRQLANITSLFEYEVKAAEDIFQGKLREQKERMAADWSGKIKRAEDDRDGKAVTDVERIATRQLSQRGAWSRLTARRPCHRRRQCRHFLLRFHNTITSPAAIEVTACSAIISIAQSVTAGVAASRKGSIARRALYFCRLFLSRK